MYPFFAFASGDPVVASFHVVDRGGNVVRFAWFGALPSVVRYVHSVCVTIFQFSDE